MDERVSGANPNCPRAAIPDTVPFGMAHEGSVQEQLFGPAQIRISVDLCVDGPQGNLSCGVTVTDFVTDECLRIDVLAYVLFPDDLSRALDWMAMRVRAATAMVGPF